jgi:hypothetical protein
MVMACEASPTSMELLHANTSLGGVKSSSSKCLTSVSSVISDRKEWNGSAKLRAMFLTKLRRSLLVGLVFSFAIERKGSLSVDPDMHT